jgi:PD-(D/E)XK nuclease superfamily
MRNPLHFLIRDEFGVSGFLASVLDPAAGNPRQRRFWQAFAEQVDLPPDELPRIVDCEVEGIDVLLLTSKACVIIENKIAAASITPGQLTRYYDLVLDRIEKRGTLGGHRVPATAICVVVYLTPGINVGRGEFDSLRLRRVGDRKKQLTWGTVFDCISSAFPGGEDGIGFEATVRAGLARTRALIDQKAENAPKTVMDPKRLALEDFVKTVETRVRELTGTGVDLKLTWWKGPAVIQVYGGLDGTDGGNVYLTVDPERSSVEGDVVTVEGSVEFKVTDRGGAKQRTRFRAIPQEFWRVMLGLPGRRLAHDTERCTLTARETWSGPRTEILESVSATFLRFLVTSRRLTSMRT